MKQLATLLVMAVTACSPAQRTAAATVADVADRLCEGAITADECARRVHARMVELDGESLLEDVCKQKP